jgi:hypothetical protein
MWNITPEDVDRVKEELKGRRAAIQARYEGEIEKLKTELDDIEAFERVATAFAQRHKREEASTSIEPDLIAPLETLPIAADVTLETAETDRLAPQPENHGEMEIMPEAEGLATTADASIARKVSSRWRVRI